MTVQGETKEAIFIATSVEAKFAQRLAANEKKIRDRTLKKLKQYMLARSAHSDGGFKRYVNLFVC